MRTIARVLLYDVLLALVYIASDAFLAYFYFSNGHKWWGALTVGAVALPGTLEVLSYTYSLLHGDVTAGQWVFWSVLFGPVLFPVSLVVWHLVMICKGEDHFLQFQTLARSRVLGSLSVLTKSCMQLILQATILMITWYHNTDLVYHSYHHYFETRGKSVRERSPYCQLVARMCLNMVHILCRGSVIALLASYLHYLSLAFVGAMILANYALSNILIKTDGSKHFWTAFAGVLLPNCFISRATVDTVGREKTRTLFKRFYKANSLIFLFLFGIGALATADCLIILTDFINFNCNNLPFLSYDAEKDCPGASPLKALHAETGLTSHLHSMWFMAGNASVLVLSVLHVICVFCGEALLSKGYEPVPRL